MSYYIIIRGPLASGKSTISKALAKEINAKYISIDKILDEFGLTKDKEEGYISQVSFKKANEIAVSRAKPVLDSGRPIIFDGNFYWQSQIEDLETRLNCSHKIFTLKISVEDCIARDIERGTTHGEIAARVVYKKVTSFDIGIPIDARKPLNEIIKQIERYLD